jgi:hypothetical protein
VVARGPGEWTVRLGNEDDGQDVISTRKDDHKSRVSVSLIILRPPSLCDEDSCELLSSSIL